MTRDEALVAARRLAAGLPAGDIEAVVAKFMERIAASDSPELLRAALIQLGAEVIVREAAA